MRARADIRLTRAADGDTARQPHQEESMGSKEQIDRVFSGLSKEVRQIVAEILEIESKYLHMTLPRGVHDEIFDMIERTVK